MENSDFQPTGWKQFLTGEGNMPDHSWSPHAIRPSKPDQIKRSDDSVYELLAVLRKKVSTSRFPINRKSSVFCRKVCIRSMPCM